MGMKNHSARSLLALLCAGLAFSSAARAATFTWQGGAGSNDWTLAGNWSPSGRANDGTADVIFTDSYLGTPYIFPNMNADYALRSLTISGGTVALGGAATAPTPELFEDGVVGESFAQAVPEPTSTVLLLCGCALFFAYFSRRRLESPSAIAPSASRLTLPGSGVGVAKVPEPKLAEAGRHHREMAL